MLVSRIKKGSVPHFLAILFLVTMVSLISLTKVEAVVSREQGLEIVIKKIVGEETEKVNIWAYPTTLTNYAEIKTPKGSIFSPYEESWFFFVDDHPFENWEHPCRYVLVDRETGEFTVAHNRMLPKDASSLELLVRCEVPKPELPIKGSGSRSEPLMTDPDPHKYAVLINGGYHLITNFTRFWNDLSAMYTTLVQHYGYMDENIYVLCSDGTNPAVDQTDYTGHVNPETGEPYFNSDPDLDQDGDPDIDYAATRANVYIVFQELQNILTASDELFVFITPHGGAEEQEDESLIYLWEQTELTDDELADLVAPISCSDMIFVILSCHSGGFIDDLSSKPHRVISTACKWEEESRPEIWYTWFGFDEFAYYWTAAVRGYYPYYDEDYWGPDDGWPLPWLEGDPIV
ncbi:MAG: C13 family peptidase, partial [Candidatus Zixiibacteriota bacterium]